MARRVLVVDDEVDIRECLRLILEDAGYEVDEAGDGDLARTMLVNTEYYALVTDLEMPRASGYDLLECLGMELAPRPERVIVCSGSLPLAVRPAYPVTTLAKPMNAENLLTAVRGGER